MGKKKFKIRFPSSGGLMVKTDYSSSVHTLQIGELVAIKGETSTWVDIGEITNILSRDSSGMKRFQVTMIPRLSEGSSFQTFTVPVSHVICVLNECNE